MGLEVSTYISGLTASWPTAGEPKSQGDDHLRLIKGALQGTFPNASKAFYLPTASGYTGGTNTTLLSSQQNHTMLFDTSAGNSNVTLPVLTSTDVGWSCEVVKFSTDGNAVLVYPTSGLIQCQVGAVSPIRVGVVCSTAKFYWAGASWFCYKSGPLVGTTVNWDGTSIPAGHLLLNGTAFSSAAYQELYYALGGVATLRDKQGRVEAGVDNAGRLSNVFTGSLGATGGLDYHYLTLNQTPSHSHGAPMADPSHSHTGSTTATVISGPGPFTYAGGTFNFSAGTVTISASGTGVYINGNAGPGNTDVNGGSNWHPNVQPTIITQKIIRAC